MVYDTQPPSKKGRTPLKLYAATRGEVDIINVVWGLRGPMDNVNGVRGLPGDIN